MKRNDVASFFYYMWNCWCEEECWKVGFTDPRHIWNKWCGYCDDCGFYGAIEKLFANLSNENQDLLVARAISKYNRKERIA